MSDDKNNVPDELEEELDELAEELRDPARGDRTIEDQGEEGRIVDQDELNDSTTERTEPYAIAPTASVDTHDRMTTLA